MKLYSADKIRNIAIAGRGGRGKTTLAEAMLYTAGATDRLGRVLDGNTVMDYDAEERRRKSSVQMAVAPIEWLDTKINLIDTPGAFDFAGGAAEGMRAAGTALIVLQSGGGVDVGAEKAYKAAVKNGKSVIFAVTKCDDENGHFFNTFDALKEEYGTPVCPVVIPNIVDGKIDCYIDFAVGKAYKYDGGKRTEVPMPQGDKIDRMREELFEAVATTDDDLMEKYFGGEPFTQDEIYNGLSAGITDGSVYPVMACSGYTTEAVDILLDSIANFAPSAAAKTGEGDLKCDPDGNLAAICFKSVADPFVGKMSYIKVVSGKITPDMTAYNPRTAETVKIGKLLILRGGKQEDTNCITAGDIGVLTKLAGVHTGDTLCSEKNIVELSGVDFPKPCLSMAVKVRKKGEEEKVAQGLRRLMTEDPTIDFYTNEETKEMILAGIGEQHLDIIVNKLKTKFGVEVDLTTPKVAYRETIKKKVEVQGRHKKQSGGHGQFGDVWIRFEPCDSEELVFAEEVFGGSVPKNFFPAVEKGLRESVQKGLVAGYPVVGIKATLYDGSYHPVDSSEMAFKTAASLAFKKLNPDANPVILEPIGTLNAYMPDENLGDIMGDITKRRGRVLGMGPAEEPKMQKLEAEVPMAEMGDFSTILRSVTIGRGYFDFEFCRYEEAPASVAQKVIEDAKKNAEEE
ncbi:MAG: elongation factor G [Clostridiales bacterium]|nr:elongation factor G [Clostridiales bacterium]